MPGRKLEGGVLGVLLVQERGMGVLKMRSQPPAASMKKLRLVSIRKTSESVSFAVLMISEIMRVT